MFVAKEAKVQAGEIQPGLCIEKLKYGPQELFWRNEVNFCAIKFK